MHLGLSEILVILATFAVLAGGLFLLVRTAAGRPSRTCPHCGQRSPDIGSFCAICGHRIGQ